jgi:xanthine dehydrogenase YagR molybdenum-binding subunit
MSLTDKAKQRVQAAAISVVKKAIAIAPDGWIPGGRPDPLIHHKHGLIGAQVSRIDGPEKVRGMARFAAEVRLDRMLYAALLYSTIPRGRLVSIDISAAAAAPGVALVMTHENAPRLKAMPPFYPGPAVGGARRNPGDAG